MATVTNLTNPYFEIDGTDYTEQTSTCSVVSTIEALESTTFGDTARKSANGCHRHARGRYRKH